MPADPFPDVRWGSDSSRLRRPAAAFASTRAGSWLIRTATPLDRKVLIRSRGRFTLLGPIGAPTLLLTTTGSKTGQPRTSPLLYWREGAGLHVVGSNFGQAHHPAWTGNLLTEPRAVVTIGGQATRVLATLLAGAERERVYAEFVALASAYDAYRSRTDRDIRVFRLEAAQATL
jgi:deazaflavin-dependent oxidoreductase (nitroreductase family)